MSKPTVSPDKVTLSFIHTAWDPLINFMRASSSHSHLGASKTGIRSPGTSEGFALNWMWIILLRNAESSAGRGNRARRLVSPGTSFA